MADKDGGAGRVKAIMAAAVKRAGNITPVMKVQAQRLDTLIDDSFRAQASPSGKPWAPLKPATLIARALKRGGKRTKARRQNKGGINVGVSLGLNKSALKTLSNAKIEIDTGALRSAWKTRSTPTGLVITNNRVYAAAQQFGRSSNRTNLVARPMAPIVEAAGGHALMKGPAVDAWLAETKAKIRRYIATGQM